MKIWGLLAAACFVAGCGSEDSGGYDAEAVEAIVRDDPMADDWLVAEVHSRLEPACAEGRDAIEALGEYALVLAEAGCPDSLDD